MSEKDLRSELTTSSKNLYVLRMKKRIRWTKKQTHLIKTLRRYIAQLNTVATSKGLNIG